MSEEDRLQVEWEWGGTNELPLDSCPFTVTEYPTPEQQIARIGTHEEVCRLTKKECRFGLTNIVVPDHCPLRDGPISVRRA